MIEYLILVWLHFVGDFILQTDKMATQKSKSNVMLLHHVTAYSLPMLFIGWQFALINGCLHFFVDFVTSRITSKLWEKKHIHWFFTTIGFDQAIHITCLFCTYVVLFK
jgi:hypothetical protein